jgi:hypothetical protein
MIIPIYAKVSINNIIFTMIKMTLNKLTNNNLHKLYAFMNILNYKLDTTNELLTSHIGLITPAHTIQVLDLSKTIDQHFPALGSKYTL